MDLEHPSGKTRGPSRKERVPGVNDELIRIQENIKYLRILAQKYPTIQDVATHIITLTSFNALPKGTEHFMSDLHGESQAFIHILNNASGVIREKIDELFGHILSSDERANFATLIYYPQRKLELVKKQVRDMDDWYRVTLQRMVELCRMVASKYSRSKVRRCMPEGYEYIIDELLHTNYDDYNKEQYYDSIVSTIVQLGMSDEFIKALAGLIKTLAVDVLHIIGDIFDRGPRPDIIMELLMDHHCVDIQWGNHDICWMGAAAGSDACIANVVNVSIQYGNIDLLENVYGISLRQLALFAQETYPDCPHFTPKEVDREHDAQKDIQLLAKMKKAIAVIMLKLEGQIIQRRPEYEMEDRLLLDKIDPEKGTVTIGGKEYPLEDRDLPTLDPDAPYTLTEEEQKVIQSLRVSFQRCEKLQRHVGFLYAQGGIYKCVNGNLLIHGCVPMESDGNFQWMRAGSSRCCGKKLMDACETLARQGYFAPEGSPARQEGRDFMWYLWCGKKSPLYGRERMTTFERMFLGDKSLWEEPKNPYYQLINHEYICINILKEFGLDLHHSHIMNGHVPVKTKDGESPVKGNGRLILIDGGFCKAYHRTTGIAGYTLISNSHGMRIVAHEPFTTVADAVQNNTDIHSTSQIFETRKDRIMTAVTDQGQENQASIEDLRLLLTAYRMGLIRQADRAEPLGGRCGIDQLF